MRTIKSNHFVLQCPSSSSSKLDHHHNIIQNHSSLNYKNQPTSNHYSTIPGNHPLKLFIDFHPHSPQHEPRFKNYRRFCSSFYSQNSISIKKRFDLNLIHFIHHHCLTQSNSFHLNHRHHNSNSPDSHSHTSSSSNHYRPTHNDRPLDSFPSNDPFNHSQGSLAPSHHNQTTWWQCSNRPAESDSLSSSLKKPYTSYKLKFKDERRQSFESYISQLSKFKPCHLSASSKTPTISPLITLNQNLKMLLSDASFQKDFKVIWSDINSIEGASDNEHVKFQVIEFQRRSIEALLNTLIHSVSTSSPLKDSNHSLEDEQNKINIFNQVVEFLIFTNQHPNSNKVISLLGLDAIEGWRNLVKQHLRIQTLKTLVSFVNIFNSNLSNWWTSELNQAEDNPHKLDKLAQVGIFLISALFKQGSVWKAYQLFWMMDKLPRRNLTSNDGESVQPISHHRRAATALGLVDALISRRSIDYANQVLETISVGEWIGGTIYRRYLLSMLTVKGARGELSSLEKIGSAYERGWANSTVMTDSVAGRNKRARGFHVQDPRIPVARAKIEALGVLGETRSAIETFQETLRTVPSKFEAASQLPDLNAEIMRVHLKADDPRSIEKLLTRMMTTRDSYGLNQPDQRHYNILLQAYANRGDIEGCSSVLDRLLASGIRPDVYTYGNISLLFAKSGEPDFIREVIEALAKSETRNQSIRPNRELWNILLDAYIESGDWTRAAKLLEYLELKENRTKGFDVVTNGSVLKALVVSGSPTDKVLETFKSMYNSQTGLTADERSYTMLLLSICDSGMMDLAETMFYRLKDSVADGGVHQRVQPNIYMYGIMISAFLKIGKPELAQGYLREMKSSGIRPNLVIYSMLTSAYAASKSPGINLDSQHESEDQFEEGEMQQDGAGAAYEMASRFRRELLNNEAHLKGRDNQKLFDANTQDNSQWGELPIIRKRLTHRLLGPIIQSYAKSARPAKALEMLRQLVASLGSDYNTVGNAGKPIDIDIFTMLMDAYRRAQDPVGVIEVWNEIFRIATKKNDSFDAGVKLLKKVLNLTQTDGHQAGDQIAKSREQIRQANKLCLPLSIYTNCLSRHGYHEEVAKSWHEVQQSGFGFDAANWNELCAAMFRSGNHRMGWWIAERIFFAKEQIENTNSTVESPSYQTEHLKWAKILEKTVGFRSARATLGLEGTRLDGAKKVESPLRPPNRTSIQKTRRFDDELAVRKSFQSLLDRPQDAIDSSSAHTETEASMDRENLGNLSWSQQLYYISQVRRDLEWRPYEQVFRMLHGSMWRECTDVVIKIWEEEQEKVDNKDRKDEKTKMESALLQHFEESVHKSVKEIVDGYELRYPQAMAEVLAMNDSQHVPSSLNKDQMYSWNKNDFILRVIKRTIERILE